MAQITNHGNPGATAHRHRGFNEMFAGEELRQEEWQAVLDEHRGHGERNGNVYRAVCCGLRAGVDDEGIVAALSEAWDYAHGEGEIRRTLRSARANGVERSKLGGYTPEERREYLQRKLQREQLSRRHQNYVRTRVNRGLKECDGADPWRMLKDCSPVKLEDGTKPRGVLAGESLSRVYRPGDILFLGGKKDVVFTGNKSLHGLFEVDAKDENDWRKRIVATLDTLLCSDPEMRPGPPGKDGKSAMVYPYRADRGCWASANHLERLPFGINEKNGELQQLLWLADD